MVALGGAVDLCSGAWLTQIVYTLDPDSRLSKAKTARWLVSNVKSLAQLLDFAPVYSLVKLFHGTL